MDKKSNGRIWVGNIYQRFEAMCQEVDLINKDTVKYVGGHMQIVGKNVKNFCSGVVQDILPLLVDPVKHLAQAIPSKETDLVLTYTESSVVINTNESYMQEGSSIHKEKCHTQLVAADSGLFVQQEWDNLINKISAKACSNSWEPGYMYRRKFR